MLASEQFIDSEDETPEGLFEGDEDADADADADDEPADLLQGDEVTEDGEEVCVQCFFFLSTHVFNATDRNRSLRTRTRTTMMTRTAMTMTMTMTMSLRLIQVYKKGLQLGPLHYPLQHHLLKAMFSLLLNHAERLFSFIWINRYHVLIPLKPYLPYPIPFQLTPLLPRLAYPTFLLVLTMVISETMIYTPL
jgi:hypothetical protein